MIDWIKEKFNVPRHMLVIYVVLYFCWGMMMNQVGQITEIARFTFWWQVITCYVLYMIPVSLFVREMEWHAQYAYGLVAMAFLEFAGYWFETSYAYPGNILDQVFGEHNFSLGMAIFFGAYFPIGNWAVAKLTGLYDKIQNR